MSEPFATFLQVAKDVGWVFLSVLTSTVVGGFVYSFLFGFLRALKRPYSYVEEVGLLVGVLTLGGLLWWKWGTAID